MPGEHARPREHSGTFLYEVALFAGTIALAVGAVVVTGNGNDTPDHKPTPQRVEAGRMHCIDPTQADLVMVDSLLDNNERANKDGYQNVDDKKVARSLGVTIHPQTDSDTILYGTAITNSRTLDKRPFRFYFDMAKQRLEQYGVDLEMPTQPVAALNAKPFTPGDLENRDSKWAMINLARAYTNIPEELVEYSGEKKIIITDLPKTVQGEVNNALSDRSYLDPPTTGQDDEVGMHELYHLIDNRECGNGVYNDTAFEDLSAPDFYKKNAPVAPSYVANIEDPGLCYKVILSGYSTDRARHRKAVRKFRAAAAQVLDYDEYAQTNEVEDKAVTGSQVLNPWAYSKFRDYRYPVLDDKFRFTLARLFHVLPATAKYLIASSDYFDHTTC